MKLRRYVGRLWMMVPVLAIALLGLGLTGCESNGADDADHTGHDHGSAVQNDGEVEVVNARCPIMDNPIDKDSVPANLTRTFDGKKVGFCCNGCPDAWDKLSEEAKRDKLAAATE